MSIAPSLATRIIRSSFRYVGTGSDYCADRTADTMTDWWGWAVLVMGTMEAVARAAFRRDARTYRALVGTADDGSHP
jgi:hypothetical protein